MQTKFKRHEIVKITLPPNPEYVEYHEGVKDFPIVPGMKGKINIILPNGQYHVEILDNKGEAIAYAAMDEEELQSDK